MLFSLLKDLLRKNSVEDVGEPSPRGFPKVVQRRGGTIICFTSSSQGDALAQLIRAMIQPVASQASRVVCIDPSASDAYGQLVDTLGDPVWFAVSFFSSGLEIEITIDGKTRNLWEAAGIPFVRLYGDTPAYFPDRHAKPYGNLINAYSDKAHSAYYLRHFPNPGFAVTLPPLALSPINLDWVDVKRKAKGKIIFPKNGNSPERLTAYWRSALPAHVASALECVAEQSIACGRLDSAPTFEADLLVYYESKGVALPNNPGILSFLVAQLDDYVRRVKSTMVARALLDLPVIVSGQSWDHVDFQGAKAVYDAKCDYASTQDALDGMLALIDMSPNTQHMLHDRVCRAIGQGTTFLTNKHELLSSVFPGAERCCYAFNPEHIKGLVEHALSHPLETVELGLEQSRVLRNVFTDEAYAEALLLAVDSVALKCGPRPEDTQPFVSFPHQVF